jgi:hypothetical protein
MLQRLGIDPLLGIMQFLSVRELLRLECVSSTMKALLRSVSHRCWDMCFERQFRLRLLSETESDESRFPHTSRIVLERIFAAIREDRMMNLLSDSVGVSSVDREEEGPRNTLRPSKCYMFFSRQLSVPLPHQLQVFGLNLLQSRCGCNAGHPCYWSSSPSADCQGAEYIDYVLKPAVALVSALSVTPYRAFFHPDMPVYAPRCVQILFLRDDGHAYYSSRRFTVDNEYREQNFVLEQPALFIGGLVRFCFLGKWQRQTLATEGLDDYYVCISQVRLHGYAVEGYRGSVVRRKGDTSSQRECFAAHLHKDPLSTGELRFGDCYYSLRGSSTGEVVPAYRDPPCLSLL